MSGDRPGPLPPATGSAAAGHSRRVLGLAYDITALATAGGAWFFMSAASTAGMYAAAGLGAIASFALGYESLRRRLIALGPGVVRYGRLWVGMMVVAALSLIDDRWQPLVLFALATTVMTLLYALGGWLGARSAK